MTITQLRAPGQAAARIAQARGAVGESQPLDLGRTQRLHSAAQRKALALTHDSFAIGTCDRPFAWFRPILV